jgi:hypothetical protein
MDVLEKEDDLCEGLVFKSKDGKGFADYNIVRCRK